MCNSVTTLINYMCNAVTMVTIDLSCTYVINYATMHTVRHNVLIINDNRNLIQSWLDNFIIARGRKASIPKWVPVNEQNRLLIIKHEVNDMSETLVSIHSNKSSPTVIEECYICVLSNYYPHGLVNSQLGVILRAYCDFLIGIQHCSQLPLNFSNKTFKISHTLPGEVFRGSFLLLWSGDYFTSHCKDSPPLVVGYRTDGLLFLSMAHERSDVGYRKNQWTSCVDGPLQVVGYRHYTIVEVIVYKDI